MKKILLSLSLALFALNGFAQDVHVVKKGDTLWDISEKYYKDNFKWPLIWKYNVHINNPDLIYPKEKLNIPVIVNDGEVLKLTDEATFKIGDSTKKGVEAAAGTVANKESANIANVGASKVVKLSDYELVLKKLPSEKVIATQEGKYFVSDGDILRVSIAKEKFAEGQEITFLRHLESFENGELLKIDGYGIVEKVEKDNAVVRVKKAFDSISKGLYVKAKKDEDMMKVSDQFVEVRSNRKGKVVYLSQSMTISGDGYRIVFDKGFKEGIKQGDIVEVVRIKSDGGFYREVKVGEAQVLYVNEDYATAAILSSTLEITRGDEVKLVKVAVY
ncbi:LysM peptidoglycan-binding domain-containing protein [Deferribacteraceae bacterium V6Fe1]|nr:LysM peptidoglycan-binding domain-containing protein [Deferribacteraceae bacterium V6Fe1]